MKKTVISIILGLLGTVPKGLEKSLEGGLNIRVKIETIQNTALLIPARIFRKKKLET